MGTTTEHCSFVLLADFDIDRGAQLTHQFPQPLGTDEGCAISHCLMEQLMNYVFKALSQPHAA